REFVGRQWCSYLMLPDVLAFRLRLRHRDRISSRSGKRRQRGERVFANLKIAGWDAHHKILEVVNQAIDESRVIHFAYTAQFRGEDFDRDFQAVCKPKPDKSGAWLAVARLQ
ncbi:MAG: hypothetical protein AAF773_05170, partial [Cyanobacteria bacterium P01_D01_bin.115]